jgi:hypothetical protein
VATAEDDLRDFRAADFVTDTRHGFRALRAIARSEYDLCTTASWDAGAGDPTT